MVFEAAGYATGSASVIEDISGDDWVPLFRNDCTFDRTIFFEVMMNTIRNPNINSSWLFRADILSEEGAIQANAAKPVEGQSRLVHFKDFELGKILVRKLIPRNSLRDQPLDQTCLLYHGSQPGETERSMVVYKPHVSSESEMPFYHPKVRGLAFLHEWNANTNEGLVSIHYCFFDGSDRTPRLTRTALHLLSTLHKHGEGTNAGYMKRVHHDTIIPQITVQTTYAKLKKTHARKLIETWAEVTDPEKHVFEDLSIAAFLIELWAEVYQDKLFPGFVDIGCGNGLLVYILRQEGYPGWGFDARKRKSWGNYNSGLDATSSLEGQPSLKQHVLLPSMIKSRREREGPDTDGLGTDNDNDLLHDGQFPKGTFIISNHADELTPWTPILATASECPFIMIPCCSHDLSGARYRAPAPKQQGKPATAYSSLVNWVSQIASDCGWHIETEMLRIPSTRNTGLIGRRRTKDYSTVDLDEIMRTYGGTDGYMDNVMKLAKAAPRGH
ncbi:hypothetical protein BJ170DRAFT_300291 [Xylariales sp. AK1849]|nr:hypothetical protein BJ170DRAFT_300291 [Xylariales sp. AK1849]